MGDMLIPIIAVVVVLIIIVLIAMMLMKKKNNNVSTSASATLNRQPNFDRSSADFEEPKVNVRKEQVVVVKEHQEPIKRESLNTTPEVKTVVDEAENVLDDIQNIIGDHQVTTNTNDNLDEKGRPKKIIENTKIDIDLTDEKAKEDVILKLKTPSNKKTPYKVKPPVHKDTAGEKVDVTINEAMEETDEPKYDKIPEYVDPKTIKENGVDAEVTEGVALKEDKKSEIDVFDDTHKEENKPLTNESGEYVEEVKSTPLHEEYEYDPEDDEIEEEKVEEVVTPTPEVDENYSKTEMLDVDQINKEIARRERIKQITEEEIQKYIQEMQDSLIDEAELYIEEMKSKVR